MKSKIILFILVIFYSCSTVNGDFDFHPEALSGSKFYSMDRSGNAMYFLTAIPNARLIRKADISFSQVSIWSGLLMKLFAKTDREIESNVLNEEISQARAQLNLEKEVLIVHNFQAKQQSNFILEGYNNFFSWFVWGALPIPSYHLWTGSADIAAISKNDLASFLGSGAGSTSDTAYNEIVVLKNGEILEGVKTTVTAKELIVTDASGKTTVYQKKEVLSVKKKK